MELRSRKKPIQGNLHTTLFVILVLSILGLILNPPIVPETLWKLVKLNFLDSKNCNFMAFRYYREIQLFIFSSSELVLDLEEETGFNSDEEPYAISSDDGSVDSEFQGTIRC